MPDPLEDHLDEGIKLLDALSHHLHRLSDLQTLPLTAPEKALAAASSAAVNKVLTGALAVLSTETHRWGI